jgi:2-phosphoglycerate kinase
MALEGVHLVPGMVPGALDGAIVSQCLIAISDEERHASHFYVRDLDSEGVRPVAKYIDSLAEIREIQEYLVEQAEKAGVPVIENGDRERAVDEVLRLVLDTFEPAAVSV